MDKYIRHIALAASVVVVLAAPARAQQPLPKDTLTEQTEKAVRKSIETIMRALENLVGSVPLYEMPEIQENGDIIIRRKKPEDPAPDDRKQKDPRDSSAT